MSKVNRISHSPEQDGESYKLQNCDKSGTERSLDSQEDMIRDVPSNWNVASTPQPEQTWHQDKDEGHRERSDWDVESSPQQEQTRHQDKDEGHREWSEWDVESSPQQEQTRHQDKDEGHRERSDWDVNSTSPPKHTGHQDKHKSHMEWSEWELESNHSQDDHFGTVEKGKDAHKVKGLDASKDKAVDDNISREDENYTPKFPLAEPLQEFAYKSPNTSRTDLNEHVHSEIVETKVRPVPGIRKRSKSPLKKGGPKLARKVSDTSAAQKTNSNDTVMSRKLSDTSAAQKTNSNDTVMSDYSDGLHKDVSGPQSTHIMALPHRNRVSPVDDTVVKRSKEQYYEISTEEQLKKKSIIFGADGNIGSTGCCGWLLYTFSILLIVVTLPFSLVFCIKVVQEYERAVIFRLGRLPLGGAKGPGIFFIIPCIESYTKIDLRTVSFDVPPQEILTKDSVTVSVDAVVYYRVSNPTVSVANVENAHHSTRLLAQTTLRNILGTKNMSEILSDRESISQGMQSTLDVATDSWGIKVERVEIKDVRLPVQLQRAMAAEAEAAREARAKVIAAEGEQKASHSLKEAADVMAQSSAALQLRYLQTLSSISSEKNSTIIFPLPIDLLKAFMEKKS